MALGDRIVVASPHFGMHRPVLGPNNEVGLRGDVAVDLSVDLNKFGPTLAGKRDRAAPKVVATNFAILNISQAKPYVPHRRERGKAALNNTWSG